MTAPHTPTPALVEALKNARETIRAFMDLYAPDFNLGERAPIIKQIDAALEQAEKGDG